MKHFLCQPQNIRIFRENIIAGIIVFLLMGFLEPFVYNLDNSRFLYFAYIGITVFVVGMLSGLFTAYVLRMPLDPKLPLNTIHRNSLIVYLINMPISAACITTIFGCMYCEHTADIWTYQGHFTWVPYLHFLYYVVSIGFFVAIGTFVRNRNWHLRYKLDELKKINDLLVMPDEEIPPQVEKTEIPCRFEGYTANSMLEVLPSNIIYIESMANYADVWYIANDIPTHKLLRITLKQVKTLLEPISYLAQCHRAFIVNLHFVIAMSNRNHGYQLQMFGSNKMIPVSRTFTTDIKNKLQECRKTKNQCRGASSAAIATEVSSGKE